jgi:hypothetical protein
MQLNVNYIYPMFAMVMLSALVLAVMFASRVIAVKSKQVRFSYFKSYQGEIPVWVAKPARHFSNLFEAPVLFYVASILAVVLPDLNVATLGLAWSFVICRFFHALVHITLDSIKLRMAVYFISWLFLLAMWVKIIQSIA